MKREAYEVETEDGIAEVLLKGPGKGNAMGPDFWRETPELFRALDADAGVRAVIVRGSGKCFSYGLDLPAMMAELGPHLQGTQMAAERTRLFDLIRHLQECFSAIERCRKPVVAAVHGYCIGGGVDMIAACDVRLCSADARFSVRETKIAIVADLGSLQRLPRIIGQGATRELAFTGRDVDAAWAERKGLVNAVLPDEAALVGAARALAAEIASNPPLTVQGAKRVLDYSADRSVADGLEYVAAWNAAFLQSRDLQEAFAAFMEKRPARFVGE